MERRLDQLHDGESGVILDLQHNDPKTRRRYAALGLVKGTRVTMLYRAPSGDPLAVRVRGYVLSLRLADAEGMLLKNGSAVKEKTASFPFPLFPHDDAAKTAMRLTRNVSLHRCDGCGRTAKRKQKRRENIADEQPITAALAGNPNSGKTTLFNAITGARESVGNFPGITVEKREGLCSLENSTMHIVDLPGIYSLTHDAAEERAARSYLLEEKPDVIINIVDAVNLERNLFLTMELRTLGIPMMLALNMMDEAAAQGLSIDCVQLAKLLGIPVVPISARDGTGICALLRCLELLCEIAPNDVPAKRNMPQMDAAAVYDRIDAIIAKSVEKRTHASHGMSERIDKVLTHRIWGIPIFLLLMGMVFLLTFDTLGAFLSDGMDRLITAGLQPLTERLLNAARAPTLLTSFVMSAVIGGIGSVLTFLPQVALLFFFLSLLEDSGYLARAAFLTDRLLRRFGLSGKACVPMLMGFGCTVPAALATRTMERGTDRRMTLFLLPYISCSAKLPVYGMIASALFTEHRGLVVLSLYVLGIGVGALVGSLLQGTVFAQDSSAFVLELPPYRRPTMRNTLLHVADRVEHFLHRAGTLIFAMNLLLWVLLHLDGTLQITNDPTISLLGRFGAWIAPVFAPLGFGNWQASVALLTGLAAKEAVTASLSMFVGTEGTALQDALTAIFTPASAYAFLVFVLLSLPCAAAVATITREWRNRRCTVLFLLLQSGVAYLFAYLAYTILGLFL